MKKLLGATALILIAGAAVAQQPTPTVTASNFNARIGGFMTMGLGFVDADAHKAEVEIINNSEVIFNFTLTADNGLTFFAKAEIENNGGPTTSDEYVGGVRGFFGTVEIGAEDGAADRLIGAPPGTAFTNVIDESGILFDFAAAESPAVPTQFQDTGDDLKVTYFTPRIAGFQAGVSYSNAAEGPTSTVGSNGGREAFELGANYQNTFGEFSVFAGAGLVIFDSPQNPRFPGNRAGDESFGFTANVGWRGFTVGGGYYVTAYDVGDDDEAYAVGASFATGPWLFGIQYAEMIGGVAEDDYGIGAGVDYALAPGVTVGGVFEFADGTRGGTQFDRLASSTDAFAVGAFLGLNF